ncbi:replication endonuclease [Pseudohongiella nitratireducens]|nr:replication endonuclease [Pseudohongiella nitratireducens]
MKIAKRVGYVEANRALNAASQRLQRGDLKLSWDDDQIVGWCKRRANECSRLAGIHDEQTAVAKITKILEGYGLEFPETNDLFGLAPGIARTECQKWWRRQVRRIQAREVDELARSWRLVHNKGEIYCSDDTLKRRTKQKARNKKLLQRLEAENDIGQTYTLDELAALGISNPEIKRAELMTRMRGFEELAQSTGKVGEFYTITCPSKYHSTLDRGIPNEKWNKSTVREAHEYLTDMWGRIRACLHRRNIEVFGFRVAEPHHDGCPHWHLLLFCDYSDIGTIRSIFTRYALQEDGEEPGAKRNRFKAVSIDPAKGSAAGYIAKYVAKNVDGFKLHDDLYGHDAKLSAARIDAWASCHGIRQFQQIGGPSVTVWRELRRLQGEEDGIIEECRQAADSANWCAFCLLMGSGRGQALQIVRVNQLDTDTGELCIATEKTVKQYENRYGEPVTGRIVGLIGQGCAAVTRLWDWTVRQIDHITSHVRSKPKPGFNLYQVGFGIGAA